MTTMIVYFVFALLHGTFCASSTESSYRDRTLGTVFGDLLRTNDSLSGQQEYEMDEDEIPQNWEETRDVAIPTQGCKSCHAFYAYLSRSSCFHTGQTVKFDQTLLNNGRRYSKNSGVFVVEEPGLYAFTWTLAAEKRTWFYSELRVNTNVRGRIMCDSDLSGPGNGIHPATGFALANVKKGDHVFIVYISGHGCMVKSDGYNLSTFSGWRIA